MTTKRVKKIFLISTIFTILLSVITLLIIIDYERKYIGTNDNTKKINILGTYYVDNNYKEVFELGKRTSLDLSGNNKITIEGNFDEDIPKNKLLIMRMDNLKANIFINGEKIYSFGEEGSYVSLARPSGNIWTNFISPGISKDDNVKIELYNIYTNHFNISFKNFLDNIYIGYENSLFLSNFKSGLIYKFISSIVFPMGVLVSVFTYILFRMKKQIGTLISFSGLCISIAFWFYLDFNVPKFVTPHLLFYNSLGVLNLYFSIFFLLMLFSSYLKSKFKNLLLVIAFLCIILINISSIMQLLRVMDFYYFTTLIYIIYILSIIVIIISIFYERYKYKTYKMKNIYISGVILFLGIVLDAFFYILEDITFSICFKYSYIIFLILQFIEIVKIIKKYIRENLKLEALKEIAYIDALTGVNNRNAYFENVDMINKSLNNNFNFGVIVFDINDLKIINDTLGHYEGDIIIKNSSNILVEVFGKEHVYRIGGDEFVVIVGEKIYSNVMDLLEKFKDKINLFNYNCLDKESKLNISYGLSIFDIEYDEKYEDVFFRADKEMYNNKMRYKEKIKTKAY